MGERFWGLIIKRIRTSLEARIAQERGKHVERMAGYSNNDDALRREFGIDLEPDVSESTSAAVRTSGDKMGSQSRKRIKASI